MAGLKKKNSGFSLTEVLLAVGILSVGMTFIAGVFPVAIHLTTVATERTVAAVVADEAFAKVQIYAWGDLDNNPIDDDYNPFGLKEDELTVFTDTNAFPAASGISPDEFAYPSDSNIAQKQYFWSALCRLTDANYLNPPVQVTVFVSRKVSRSSQYPDPNGSGTVNRPMPVKVEVSGVSGKDNELSIDNADERTFINDGYTIVDNVTGRIYRVLERYRDAPGTPEQEDEIVLLDRNWDGSPPGGPPDTVWVVPPPVNGGRYPCIAVYQKIIGF